MSTGSIAEDPLNCEVISREEGAVQQLIPMALSDNEIVVEQACKTIGQFIYAESPKILLCAKQA